MMKKITLALVAFVIISATGIAAVETLGAQGLQTLRNDVRSVIQTPIGPSGFTRNLSRIERRVYNQPSQPVSHNAPTIQTPAPIAHKKLTSNEPLVTQNSEPIVTEETNHSTKEAPAPAVSSKTEERTKVPTPSISYLDQIESEIHRLTNEERTKAALAPLRYDPALATVATAHSEDMAQTDYFSHVAPNGCTLACRLGKANYSASSWGENISWASRSTLPEASALAEFFVDSWMNSPSHRENILRTTFSHEGIGLAQTGNRVYATANFSTLKQ
jgi:uncharacterized protein YkwD